MTGMVKSSPGVLLSLDKPLYRKTDNHLGTFLTTSASRNKPNRHPVAAVDAMMAKMSAMADASRRKRRAMAVPSFGSFGHLSGEEGTQYSVTAMLHYAASLFIALIWNAIFAELYALVVHVLPVSVWDVVSFTPQKTAAATSGNSVSNEPKVRTNSKRSQRLRRYASVLGAARRFSTHSEQYRNTKMASRLFSKVVQ